MNPNDDASPSETSSTESPPELQTDSDVSSSETSSTVDTESMTSDDSDDRDQPLPDELNPAAPTAATDDAGVPTDEPPPDEEATVGLTVGNIPPVFNASTLAAHLSGDVNALRRWQALINSAVQQQREEGHTQPSRNPWGDDR